MPDDQLRDHVARILSDFFPPDIAVERFPEVMRVYADARGREEVAPGIKLAVSTALSLPTRTLSWDRRRDLEEAVNQLAEDAAHGRRPTDSPGAGREPPRSA